jgi:hypothetical protein
MVNDISATSTASKIQFSNLLAMDGSDRDPIGNGKRKAEEMEPSPSPGPRARARHTSPSRDTSPSPMRDNSPSGMRDTSPSPTRDTSPSRDNNPSPSAMSESDYEYSPSPIPNRSPSVSPAPYLPVERSKTGDFPVRYPLVIPDVWPKDFIAEQNDRISQHSTYSNAHIYLFDKLNKSFLILFNHAKD